MKSYLTQCVKCGGNTNRQYARTNAGQCKSCVHPEQAQRIAERSAETRQGRIIDHGYDAYAREEGHYDLPDYA